MEFVDEIYKTVETMIQRYFSKLNISNQKAGVVIEVIDENKAKYKVRINGADYIIKDGINLHPEINTSVWVCLPNNDWNQAYICARK